MPIIRISKHQHNFLLMDKTGLEDPRLSYRAKGLLAYLLSKPDAWEVHVEQLAMHSPTEGRDAIRSALRELEKAGYARRQKKEQRLAHGRLAGWETVVFETPHFTDYGLAVVGESTDKNENVDKSNTSSDYGLAVVGAQSTDYGLAEVGKPVVGLLDLKRVSIELSKDCKTKTEDNLHLGSEDSAVVETDATTCGILPLPAEECASPAQPKKPRTPKVLPVPWPTAEEDPEAHALSEWILSQQVLTVISPPTDYDWWCDMSYVINGLPTIEWLERRYAKIQMYYKANPRKKPTPGRIPHRILTWLEKDYNDEQRRQLPTQTKEVHIHYDNSGPRRR